MNSFVEPSLGPITSIFYEDDFLYFLGDRFLETWGGVLLESQRLQRC